MWVWLSQTRAGRTGFHQWWCSAAAAMVGSDATRSEPLLKLCPVSGWPIWPQQQQLIVVRQGARLLPHPSAVEASALALSVLSEGAGTPGSRPRQLLLLHLRGAASPKKLGAKDHPLPPS